MKKCGKNCTACCDFCIWYASKHSICLKTDEQKEPDEVCEDFECFRTLDIHEEQKNAEILSNNS